MNAGTCALGLFMCVFACGRAESDTHAADPSSGGSTSSTQGGAIALGGLSSVGGVSSSGGRGSIDGIHLKGGQCGADPAEEPIPDIGACSATTFHCEAAMTEAGSCPGYDLRPALEPMANDCGAICGNFSLGMRSGCVAAVDVHHLGVDATSPAEATACLEASLLATRWDCVNSDGWVLFHFGSCLPL